MDRPMTRKTIAYLSTTLLLLAVSPAVYGQAAQAASAEQIQALQKKLHAYKPKWPKCRASYNGSPAALLRPLTRLQTSQLLSPPSNKKPSPRPRRN